MKRVHDSLQNLFQRNRLIFWYDQSGEWRETFDTFTEHNVEKLAVAGNELATKVRIVRDPNPDQKFLIYIPQPRPSDTENWLLDLLLQGYEYKADRASLDLQGVGLPYEFRHLAEEHSAFFRSSKRSQELKDLLNTDDQTRDIRLKMMAVLAGTTAAVGVDELLLHFLSKGLYSMLDPVNESLDAAALGQYFWQEVERVFGYTSATPSIRDFAVALFRGANPLDTHVTLHPHGKVFLQRWKDSQEHQASFRSWSKQMERELRLEVALSNLEEPASIAEADTFEIFEKYSVHRLCQLFETGVSASEIRALIEQRKRSFWYPDHLPGYAALQHAVELRELLGPAELSIESMADGVNSYLAGWWRIDRAYRLSTWYFRQYGQIQVTERIAEWVERTYINNFLLPLSDRWSDHVSQQQKWDCDALPPQRHFFITHVQPFLSKGQKVFVIISDALRYEAAADFAARLQSENRWTAELHALFGSLPSYTQLGMATLLPGKEFRVDGISSYVSVDGKSANGTPARAEILRAGCGAKATAMQAEDFLELNTKTDGRALMRDHDVVYIYHNVIDKIGDVRATEAKTFDAVEHAFDELRLIIKKVANINGNNMLLTADHGFLFQQDAVGDDDMEVFPNAEKWTFTNRRFALGKSITPNRNVKIFEPAALKLTGDWTAAFPLSLRRFPVKGSGRRFVHGGIALQEIIVPVVKIHKARTDDTEQVEIEILRAPAKITTGQVSISLFQEKAVTGKILPRTIRVGVYSTDGKALSEIKTLNFDSKEEEARRRETTIVLVMSQAADAFNNHDVELRLEEQVRGTDHFVTYKKHNVRLQKPFMSDFDEP